MANIPSCHDITVRHLNGGVVQQIGMHAWTSLRWQSPEEKYYTEHLYGSRKDYLTKLIITIQMSQAWQVK